MATIKAPSSEDIKAGFVFPTLDTIVGEPNYTTLELAHTQCIRNATTLDSRLGGGGHGHAGLVEFPDVYLLRTGTHFNRPPYPGDGPIYPIDASAAQRATTLHQWQVHQAQYQTCQRIEKILLSMLENAIEATYLTGIHDPAHGFGARSLIDVFQYLFATYGSLGPDEILRNQQRMTAPVDPTQPIAVLFKQIEDCQKFAAACQVAITPAQVLKAAETLILQTGRYSSAYREWMALNETEKTYHNFKTRMTKEYQLLNTMSTTAREAGYHHGANAASETNDESLAAAAQDFAAATAADRAAFEQLATTNGDLNHQLAHMAVQNQQMTAQMAQLQQHMMYMATTPAPRQRGNRGRGGRGRRGNLQQPPPAPYMSPTTYTAAPAYQPVAPANYIAPPTFQQPPIPPHGFQTTTYGAMPGTAPAYGASTPYTPMQQAAGFQPHGQYGAPALTTQRPANAKRNNNQNYCWTHGGDIAATHTSATCQKPAMNHNPHATRHNTMGGNQKDLHRVYMGAFS